MLRLRTQPLGIFTEPPRTIHLTQMVPFGERGAATVTKRDVRVEREENVLMAAVLAALAEELPLQLSVVRVSEVEEDVPVDLGQGRGPRRAFVHYAQTRPKRLFRQNPLGARGAARARPATRVGLVQAPLHPALRRSLPHRPAPQSPGIAAHARAQYRRFHCRGS